jgi:hypothetical protein
MYEVNLECRVLCNRILSVIVGWVSEGDGANMVVKPLGNKALGKSRRRWEDI